MTVAQQVMKRVVPSKAPVPKTVEERIKRGRERLGEVAPKRNECLEFWRGEQYWYVDQRNVLQELAGGGTGIRAAGKPSWRVREAHNLLVDVVAHEVSAASSVTPPYEVVPTTGDPEDASTAKLAEKVAIYGYDKWNLRDARVKAVTHAVVADEAFAWVYWDSSIGPFIDGEDVGVGDVRVEIYSGNQVYWEPGQRFERSDWHCIDIAMTPEAAKRLDGYSGGELIEDADVLSQTSKGEGQRKQVLVTYYLERPTPKEPKGRWLTIANERQICPEQDYPGDGTDPCLHKLTYFVDPDSDRDMGLVRHLLTAQRTFNDAANKIAEWKNAHLMGGRVFITPGLLQGQRLTDEPAQVVVVPNPNENVMVQQAPPVPAELFQIRDDAQSEMARIAAQNDIPSQVESGKAIVPLLERDLGRRKSFFINLAEFDARIMRACLALVQRYYSEDRTLQIKGDFGWESLRDFQGSQLSDQTDVRVNPAGLEPLTRENIEQRVIAFADRTWISPEEAMHAITTGTAEGLLSRIERAEARVDRVIRRVKEGPEALMAMGFRVAPPGFELPPDQAFTLTEEFGMPPGTVPGWMPLPWDNLRLWRSKMEDFFQTEAAEMLPVETQGMANVVYTAVLALEAQEQLKQAQAQQMMAAEQGMGNAAKPQGGSPSPDMPQLGQGGPPTPNQPPSQSTPS